MKILHGLALTLVLTSVAANVSATEKTVYGWECKTKTGEVVLNGMHSVPFKVGQVVEASFSAPAGKAVGVKDAGACSKIRYDLVDGRVAYCEPIGIPGVHSAIEGWSYRPINKSQRRAKVEEEHS